MLQKIVGNIERGRAQMSEAFGGLHAYLSGVSSFSAGGSVLCAVGGGSCGEGWAGKPAPVAKRSAGYLTRRRGLMHWSRAAHLAVLASLIGAPTPLTMLGRRATHPPQPEVLERGRAGSVRSILRGSSVCQAVLASPPFLSRALGKANRAQRPHKTHRLIYNPALGRAPILWGPTANGSLCLCGASKGPTARGAPAGASRSRSPPPPSPRPLPPAPPAASCKRISK
jgi:hypothetical protein